MKEATAFRPTLVAPTPPDTPRGIDVHDLQHRDIKTIDWTRVHLAGDKNPPIRLGRCFGRWSMPVSRKGKS